MEKKPRKHFHKIKISSQILIWKTVILILNFVFVLNCSQTLSLWQSCYDSSSIKAKPYMVVGGVGMG